MLKSIYKKWTARKRYQTFTEMPDCLLAVLGVTGFLVAGYYGFILNKVTPDYLKTANNMPLSAWGPKGWLLTAILAVLGFMTWHFGSIAWRCNGILRDRWYK
jgi:hypothetical protein